MQPFFVMLTVCLSKTASRPSLYIFSINIRGMCDNPGSKQSSPTSSSNCDIPNVHTVADGSRFLDADKTYIVCHCLCSFTLVSYGLRYVPYSPVFVSPYFVLLSMVWGWTIVLT